MDNHDPQTPSQSWTYRIEPIGAELYLLHGVDNRGHQVDSVGTDADILEEDFLEAAQKIDRSARVDTDRHGV